MLIKILLYCILQQMHSCLSFQTNAIFLEFTNRSLRLGYGVSAVTTKRSCSFMCAHVVESNWICPQPRRPRRPRIEVGKVWSVFSVEWFAVRHGSNLFMISHIRQKPLITTEVSLCVR